MSRSLCWVQDSGSIENLFKIVSLFELNSVTNKLLKETQIPNKIQNQILKDNLISSLNNNGGFLGNPMISFKDLVGKRMKDNNVSSIIQCLLPGQRGGGLSDWACDNFVRFAYSLNFISYNAELDSFTITEIGLQLNNCENDVERYEIVKVLLKKYPPAIRVLELLFNQFDSNPNTPSLTKFEIGKELGFKGENGFTTYSQNVYIQALNFAESNIERRKIKTDWEGSSDKYARMICGWLSHPSINWVQNANKDISVTIGNETYTENLQAYQITHLGVIAFRSCRSYSRNSGTTKFVHFEMLATKKSDRDFLRLRRAKILVSINQPKNLEQIISYLESNNIGNVTKETIIDDIKNFSRIGLSITNNQGKYKLNDSIELLQVPVLMEQNRLIPSNLEQTKQVLRTELINLDHEYLDILDFSIAGQKSARQFEVRIVELLNHIIVAKHLSGGNRPEIIGYNPKENPKNCIIMDSKSYANGFNIPAGERDKMIRYVDEFNSKDNNLNTNRWWENFSSPNYPTNEVIYSFVSSSFISQYANQLTYIKNRTNINGSAITAETLLRKVENVMNVNTEYNLNNFFEELGSNKLVA